jgi:acetyl-CoA acyltransferase
MNLLITPYESLESTSRGKFDKQIVPITVDQTFVNEKGKKLNLTVNKDEGPRAGTSKEVLAKTCF